MARRVLHLGPYQPVLESRLVEEIGKVRADDLFRPIVVLAPTALLCQHLKRMVALRSERGHAGVRFVNVPGLARAIAERAMRSEGLAPLPEGAETVLWRRAVGGLPPGGFFEPIKGSRGFAAATRATVRDLKDAGVTPAVIERKAVGASRLERKLRDLAGIWRTVETATREAGFHDEIDLLRRAGELAPDSPWLEGAAAFLYGFYDLTRAQRLLVHGFLQRPIAAAFMPWADEDGDEADRLFAYAEGTRDFLQGSLDLIPDDAAPVAPKRAAPFRVVAAPGEPREAMEIARAITGSEGPLRETGVLMRAPSSQAPLLDEALEDAGIPRFLSGELPLAHLPVARALRLMLECRRESYPRTVLMELVTTAPMRFERLVGKGRPVTPGIWDVLAREWGVVSGIGEWRARLAAGLREIARDAQRSADPADEELRTRSGAMEWLERARALDTLLGRFFDLLEAIPLRGSWSAIAGAIGSAFETLFDFREQVVHVRSALESIGRLDGLGGTLAEGTLTEVEELLDEALGSPRPRPEDSTFEGPGVLVADLMKARGLPFRTVVLPGMIEGVFPRIARPDPLLSDFERRSLNKELTAISESAPFDFEGGEAAVEESEDLGADGPLPLKGASAAEERLLFRLAMEAASEEVVFTLPRLDPATGRERVPSWLLLKLLEREHGGALTLEAFARHPRVSWLPLDPAPADRARALTRLERDLFDVRAALASGDAAKAAGLLARSPFGASVVRSERGRWGERRFTAYDGWLVPAPGDTALAEAVAKIGFRAGAEISATRLEHWANCPYQYFLKHGLGLEPLEEPERRMTIDARDRGLLIHKVLERFWREERAAGRLPLDDAGLEAAFVRLDEVLAATLAEFETTGIIGPRLIWEAEKAEIGNDLRQTIRVTVTDGAGWVPAEFELGFGAAEDPAAPKKPKGSRLDKSRQLTLFGEEAPPAPSGLGRVQLESVETAGAAWAFRGRIDRVDVSSDGTKGRVVDYKTGKAKVTFRARGQEEPPVFYGGTALQLPLYVLAAKQRFPEVKDWSAVYDYCTRRGGFQRNGIDVDDAVLERLRELVSWIASDAAAGRFPFFPDEQTCMFCDYKEVCGPGHDVAFERKAEADPAFHPFQQRREDYR